MLNVYQHELHLIKEVIIVVFESKPLSQKGQTHCRLGVQNTLAKDTSGEIGITMPEN